MTATPIRHVGHVGLGTMGAPIATNLVNAGFAVTVWNRTVSRADALAARGAQVARTLAELGRSRCEAVFLNVNDGPAVRDVLFGSGGLAANLATGTIVIDNSTIAAHEAQVIAAELQASGVAYLDAPVSGGAAGAAAGTLSVMVGGDAAVVERVLPLLQVIGKTITHLGPVGMGQACKACNQVAVAVTLLGVCEALALAKQLGVDAPKLLEVLGGGGAASQQLKNYGAKIFAGDLKPGFAVKLMLKDLGIARDSAAAHGLPLNGAALAEKYLRQVADTGGGELGTQAMSRVLEQLGGFRFARLP